MNWQQERRWGQAWAILAAVAVVGAFVLDGELAVAILVIAATISVGMAAVYGYRALLGEAREKGW